MIALVLGGAACVWRDVAAFERLMGAHRGIVVAANDVGVHWSRRLDHWCSIHSAKLRTTDPRHPDGWSWERQRMERGHPTGWKTWGVGSVKHPWKRGSSGLFAVQVALMHADLAVLAGIPMSRTPHFSASRTHDPRKPWTSANAHWRGWADKIPEMRGRVSSMSGRTRDLLGTPTKAWAEADDE